MFHVGQKVVCVDGGDVDCEVDEVDYGPAAGDICTVTNAYMAEHGYLMLELAEFPSPETETNCAGWMAIDFRPVVERKTDISIFHEILRKATKQRPVGSPVVSISE